MPKPHDLLAERFEDALHRELAAVVEAEARHGDQPAHRGDGDDVARTALPHVRQHGLDHRHGSVDVHLELTAKVIHRRLLEEAVMAVSGVGDEYVDRAQVALGLVHDRVHRVMVGHVQDAGVRVAA